MVSKHDLERLDAIILALMCKKLSQDESQPAALRETARKFKEEWIKIQDSEVPQKGNGKQFGSIQEQVANIKARMVDFLAPLI
jgi:uncharacterized protein HemX